jgi:hypothetical protein
VKILVVGPGAREHAIVHALAAEAASGEAHEIHAAPGNPGIAAEATLHPVDAEGRFDRRIGEWAGVRVKDADRGIIDDLKGERNKLSAVLETMADGVIVGSACVKTIGGSENPVETANQFAMGFRQALKRP